MQDGARRAIEREQAAVRQADAGLGLGHAVDDDQSAAAVGQQAGACRAHRCGVAVVLARGRVGTDSNGQRGLEDLAQAAVDGGDGVVEPAVAVVERVAHGHRLVAASTGSCIGLGTAQRVAAEHRATHHRRCSGAERAVIGLAVGDSRDGQIRLRNDH